MHAVLARMALVIRGGREGQPGQPCRRQEDVAYENAGEVLKVVKFPS